MLKKTIFVLSIITALASLYPYILMANSVFHYPYSIYLDEGSYIRKALVFMTEGIRFNSLSEYPYFITVYGFLYELVISFLLLFVEPSVNAGRIVSLVSTIFIILILFAIIYRKTGNFYLASIFSFTVVYLKQLAVFTVYSKNDLFLGLLSLIVLYSLYFHKGKRLFVMTLMFTALSLMTKQPSIFLVPLIITWFYVTKENLISFLRKSTIWLTLLSAIFAVLFITIPNYYYNTIIIPSKVATLFTSYNHMIFSQSIPFIRTCIVYIVMAIALSLLNRKRNIKVITPALLFLFYYTPVFLLTSMNTGSMPSYYVFFVIGISVFIPELITANNNKFNSLIHLSIFLQLLIFLFFTSTRQFMKFYYPVPTESEITESRIVDTIVKEHEPERSFVTFSCSSFGLTKQSAKNHFDFNHSYLKDMNLLDITPYINEIKKKKFSVIVGRFDYPEVVHVLLSNYYLYSKPGAIPIYLPIEDTNVK